MEIEYKGGTSIKLKAGSVNVVIDPKLSLIGGTDLKLDDVIEIVTEQGQAIDSDKQKLLIEGPGEYEVSNVSVKGVAAKSYRDSRLKTTLYRIDMAGFRLAIIGNVEAKLSESQLEELGVVDIISIPVGGNGHTLNAHEAAALVRQLDPKIVIPVHYKDKSLKYETDQDDLDGFLKELGATQHEEHEKLKLKAGTTLPAILTVIEVKRS